MTIRDPVAVLGLDPLAQGAQILGLCHAASDHATLAALGNDGSVVRYDVALARPRTRTTVPMGRHLVAFPTPDRLIVATHREVVVVGADGEAQPLFALPPTAFGGPSIEAVFGSVDGEVVVAAVPQGEAPFLRVWRGGAARDLRLAAAFDADRLGVALPDVPSWVATGGGVSADGEVVVVTGVLHRVVGGAQGRQNLPVTGFVAAWDTASGALRSCVPVDPAAIFLGNDAVWLRGGPLAVSPDGRAIAVRRRVLELDSGVVRFDKGGASRVAFADNGTLVAVDGDRIWVLDASNGAVLEEGALGKPAFVLAMSATADSIAVADDRFLMLFDRPGLIRRGNAGGLGGVVSTLAVGRGGRVVYAATNERCLRWVDGALVAEGPGVSQLSLAADGDGLVAVRFGAATLLDPTTLAPGAAGMRADTVAWAASGPVAVGYDQLWDDAEHGEEGAATDEGREDDEEQHAAVRFGAGAPPVARAWVRSPYLRCVPVLSADGRRALLHDEYAVHGWDVSASALLWSRSLEVTALAMSPDGRYAVAATFSDQLLLMDGETGETLADIPAGVDALIQGLAWSPAHDRLAVLAAQQDPFVLALALPPAGAVVRFRRVVCRAGHVGDVYAVAFDAAGEVVATGGTDGRVAVFDLGADRDLEGTA